MAINKNDYLDGNGNYDLKKDLVDELIDAVNPIADYVVDTGVSNGADFVKYASGRITIRQIVILNASLSTIPSPIAIMPNAPNKPRFARANIATYDVTNTKYVTTSYVEGSNIIIQAEGISGNDTHVAYEVNAWWK